MSSGNYARLGGAARRRGTPIRAGAIASIGTEYVVEPIDESVDMPSVTGRDPLPGGRIGAPLTDAVASGGGWFFRGVVGCTLASMTVMLLVLTIAVVSVIARNYSSVSATTDMLSNVSGVLNATLSVVSAESAHLHVNASTALQVAESYVLKVMEMVDTGHGMVMKAEDPFNGIIGHLDGIHRVLESSEHQGLVRDIDDLSQSLKAMVEKLQDMGITLHIGT